jgi:hypothetical protein
MAIKISKNDTIFRNELIFTVDAKAVNIDNTLVNLFILLQYNGSRPRAGRSDRKHIDFERISKLIEGLEKNGDLEGFKDHPIATNLWLRSNLINLANRGKLDKEKIVSMRPIHLESYKIRNQAHARDYNSSDQVYLMLSENIQVREQLKKYLAEGWDPVGKNITGIDNLDIDSLALLLLSKHMPSPPIKSASTVNRLQPVLKKQAQLFCDDIRRLLVYRNTIPRNVLVDYLKTIISFHLSLYLQKLMTYLPAKVNKGNVEIEDHWNIVVDVTDNYESRISAIATKDAELMNSRIYDYIKATFQINASLDYIQHTERNDSRYLPKALEEIQNRSEDFERAFEADWRKILKDLSGSEEEKEEDKAKLEELTQFEKNCFDKYVALLVDQKGNYQYRYHNQLIDNLSQKNNERGFMAAGRSRKHPRKYVLGTKLLETLVQILVLKVEDDRFESKSLSIDELIQKIRDRYGLIINGINEERFHDADLNCNMAFKENVEALKHKLRQIGFYNDLSDAYILQKVRPRYNISNNR